MLSESEPALQPVIFYHEDFAAAKSACARGFLDPPPSPVPGNADKLNSSKIKLFDLNCVCFLCFILLVEPVIV